MITRTWWRGAPVDVDACAEYIRAMASPNTAVLARHYQRRVSTPTKESTITPDCAIGDTLVTRRLLMRCHPARSEAVTGSRARRPSSWMSSSSVR